jgi:hypothetical protein
MVSGITDNFENCRLLVELLVILKILSECIQCPLGNVPEGIGNPCKRPVGYLGCQKVATSLLPNDSLKVLRGLPMSMQYNAVDAIRVPLRNFKIKKRSSRANWYYIFQNVISLSP